MESDETMKRCANCGVKEDDDIKLKICTACKSVRYCGINCQKEHRPKHKKACKKRAAELLDELLFKQPESGHLGYCPICCLPFSTDRNTYLLMMCCSTLVCGGCAYAEIKCGRPCPFCRKPGATSLKKTFEYCMKRVEANDHVAMQHLGELYQLKNGDYTNAFKYYSMAVKVGNNIEAHYALGNLYFEGLGCEEDEKKALFHWTEAAIGGHEAARHQLATIEISRERYERAAKHLIIAANLGLEMSLPSLRDLHRDGHISKEEFAAALRGYQTAADATKSSNRDEVAKMKLRTS